MSVAHGGAIALPLRPGLFAYISPEDADLAEVKWSYSKNGYAVRSRRQNGKRTYVYLHRIIAERIHGAIPDGSYVDHSDRDRLNNRRNNIRTASAPQSTVNRSTSRGAMSGYRGVYYLSSEKCKRKKPWLAQIGAGKKSVYLGYFATPEQAARAYNDAALRYYGEFAELNEIPD